MFAAAQAREPEVGPFGGIDEDPLGGAILLAERSQMWLGAAIKLLKGEDQLDDRKLAILESDLSMCEPPVAYLREQYRPIKVLTAVMADKPA